MENAKANYFLEWQPRIKFNRCIFPDIEDEIAKFAETQFYATLPQDFINLKEALVHHQWQLAYFLAERLLGIALYFEVPKLQIILKAIMTGVVQHHLAFFLLEELTNEIARLLGKTNESIGG